MTLTKGLRFLLLAFVLALIPAAGTYSQTADKPEAIPLQIMPRDNMGNVDWVAALKQGIIKPRDSLDPDANPTPVIDLDIEFKVKGGLPNVIYPHYPHTQWLMCSNCHPKIFIMQAGANPITQEKIEKGEYCGRCHGKVSFPISNCTRCHSKGKK